MANDIADELRKIIRQAARQGLTRYRLSRVTGVDQSNLSRFMHGKGTISLDKMSQLAEALGYEISLTKR